MASILTFIFFVVVWGYLAIKQTSFDKEEVQRLTDEAKEASMKGDRERANRCYERLARIKNNNKWC